MKLGFDNDKYLAKSKSKLSTSEIITAPRGKILDRYGRPIVTNRLGFSVSFTDASLSNDELNDLILNTVTLFNENEDEYIDMLMLAKYLEKIGDHAVNIAKWQIFRVEGELV